MGIPRVRRGVCGDWAGSKDFCLADNVFVGRHDSYGLIGFRATSNLRKNLPGCSPLVNGPGGSELAVDVYGQGHVVAYDEVNRFHDGIDHARYGSPDGSPKNVIEENVPGSVDFYGNDMSNLTDDGFETDGGTRNMRVFRNRCVNSAERGLNARQRNPRNIGLVANCSWC
jgi:hypothetical protein